MSPFLHIKSLFISVLVHIAVNELLHLDGVDHVAPRDLGDALLHDLLVAAPGNLLPAVEGVQNSLDLFDDALLQLQLGLFVTSLRDNPFLAPLFHNLNLGCLFIDTRDCLFVATLPDNLFDDAPLVSPVKRDI